MATGRIGVTPTLRTRWSKAPAGGTTSLSGLDDNSVSLVYDVGYEAVYRNGVLLSRGNDYTATDGTSITLVDATITGDIIEVFANNIVPLTDTYSQGVADSKFVNNSLVDAKGDIITATAADTPARLAVGTNGQYLQADSTTSTGLKWADVSAGGMTLISTATPSAATTVSFTSIPTTYKTLLLVWDNVFQSATDVCFGIRLNNDTTGKHWWYGQVTNDSAAFATNSGADETVFGTVTAASPIPSTPTAATNINRTANGQMWIFNADQTTGYKRVHWTSTGYNNNVAQFTGPISINGTYTGTSAISRIDFIRSSTQTITGTIRLYGVS